MAYDTTIRTSVFRPLGVYIRWWHDLEDMKDTLDDRLDNAIKWFYIGATPPAPNDVDKDKAAYEAFSVEIKRQKEELASLQQSVVNLVSDYFGLNVKALIESPYASSQAVLDDLIDEMGDFDSGPDNVLKNTATVDDPVTEDEDNSATSTNLNFGATDTQMAVNEFFCLTCVDDSVVDEERWTLESGSHGQFPGEIVTGEKFDWKDMGFENMTIAVANLHNGTDPDNKIGDWKITGAVCGTNVADDGTVYIRLNTALTASIENDDATQLDSLSWQTEPEFGKETDTDGKLHVSVSKEPADLVVSGGERAVVSDLTLFDVKFGSGSTNQDASADGYIYVTISEDSGTYTVDLHSIPARSDTGVDTWVATGSTTTAPSSTTTISLAPRGSHTVNGSLILESLDNDFDDKTIVIQVPKYRVQAYRSESRLDEDLVCEGSTFLPNVSAMDLAPASGFSVDGSVNFFYAEDNDGIVVTRPFYTIDMYRADPANGGTDDDIVARAGTFTDLSSSQNEADVPFYEVNGSGITTASVDITAFTVTSLPYDASIRLGYTTGDMFTFQTTTNNAGQFQMFLRDNFGKVFPSVSTDPEVQEAWIDTPGS